MRMRWLFGGAGAILLLANAAPPLAGPEAAKAKVEEARARLSSGDGNAAIALFREAVRLDPDNAPAHNALGSLFNRSGRYAEALPHAIAAVRIEPANMRYRYNRGVVLAEHGRFAEALADFDAALAADPGNTYGWLERGAVKLALNDLAGARSDWKKAEENDAKLIWPIWYQATGDFVEGRYADAAAGFDRVAAAEAGFVPARLWQWIAHGRAGKSVALPDGGGEEWPAPVLAALRGTTTPERLLAVAEQDRTTGDRRRSAEALYFLAQQALILGDRTAAESYLRRALDIPAPRHVWRIAAERDLRLLEAG